MVTTSLVVIGLVGSRIVPVLTDWMVRIVLPVRVRELIVKSVLFGMTRVTLAEGIRTSSVGSGTSPVSQLVLVFQSLLVLPNQVIVGVGGEAALMVVGDCWLMMILTMRVVRSEKRKTETRVMAGANLRERERERERNRVVWSDVHA